MNILLRTDFKTNARGYTLLIARDLFGDLSVVRCWYGLHNNRGGHKHEPCHDWNEALDEYRRITDLRLRRGYQEIAPIEVENAA